MTPSALPTNMLLDRSELERVSQSCIESETDDYGTKCRVLGKYICYVDPQDKSVAQHLINEGYWESWITLAWLRELRPGLKVIDIGANCGYYTLTAADAVGSTGSVCAFEPQPKLAHDLEQSLLANGYDNTIVRTEAISDGERHQPLYILDELNGSSSLTKLDDSPSVMVDTVALDSILPTVNLIKIDAEGAEEAIWHGMQKTLDLNPDITIIMEIDSRRYTDAAAFYKSIAERFPLQMIATDGNIVPFQESGDIEMLYLKREKDESTD